MDAIDARNAPRRGRPRRALALAALVVALCAPAVAAETPGPVETEVRVERVRPHKQKYATVRFLKENRDFIRARFDRLRERVVTRPGEATAIDPRFLRYQGMLTELLAAGDSLRGAEEERARRELLASVTDLGLLEAQLDLLERALAEQRRRLGVLAEDFAGDQRTALAVVLSGDPGAAVPEGLSIALEDGSPVSITLSAEQIESLRHGGVVQVLHRLVEPREQVVEVGVSGAAWSADGTGFVRLEPARDRLTLLRLDLSRLDPARGATSIQASTWLHDPRTPHHDG